MGARLLTDADLPDMTGLMRYSKLGIDAVTGARGRPIRTWSTHETLCAKRAGRAPAGEARAGKVELYYDY